MNRLVVFALVASIGQASAAFAGDSILTSGTRHVQELAVTAPASTLSPDLTLAATAVPVVKPAVSAYQGSGGNLSKSGMSRGKKALIYIGLGVGFAAGAYTIDHHVLNVTPSSLGKRLD